MPDSTPSPLLFDFFIKHMGMLDALYLFVALPRHYRGGCELWKLIEQVQRDPRYQNEIVIPSFDSDPALQLSSLLSQLKKMITKL
jgi:hypothetical protein